jgi:hypothetical protein
MEHRQRLSLLLAPLWSLGCGKTVHSLAARNSIREFQCQLLKAPTAHCARILSVCGNLKAVIRTVREYHQLGYEAPSKRNESSCVRIGWSRNIYE